MPIPVISFAGQNWLITPAALAVNEAKPANISEQKWLLVLTGVCIINLQGASANDWRRENLIIFPDMQGPLQFAVNKFSIPKPPNPNVFLALDLEEWAPFAAISSVLDKTTSSGVDAGFAVDAWRHAPFFSGTDAVGKPVAKGFQGISVDVAVRNNKATLHRVSYNITLLGKIAFLVNVIL
jgi:hypothetical protein